MTRRTAEPHNQDSAVADPAISDGGQEDYDDTAVDMPLRSPTSTSEAHRFPQQLFSMAYGMTIKARHRISPLHWG